MTDERIMDRVVSYIRTIDSDYVYERDHFRLEQGDDLVIIKDWSLNVKKPTMESLMKIDLKGHKKHVEKDSLQDILRRLEALELKTV